MLFPNRDRIIEALLDSPQAKAAVEAQAKETARTRAALVKELANLEERAEADYHAHEKALASAMAEVERAELALSVARRRVAELVADRTSSSVRRAASLERIEAALRETADPAIDAFIQEMEREWQANRRRPAFDSGEWVTNTNTGRKEYKPGQKVVTPGDRSRAIREVIAAAHGLKLDADQAGVTRRLERLRASIPEIGAPIA